MTPFIQMFQSAVLSAVIVGLSGGALLALSGWLK